MKLEYPKCLYRGEESRIVKDADEHKAQGPEWTEAPGEPKPAERPTLISKRGK